MADTPEELRAERLREIDEQYAAIPPIGYIATGCGSLRGYDELIEVLYAGIPYLRTLVSELQDENDALRRSNEELSLTLKREATESQERTNRMTANLYEITDSLTASQREVERLRAEVGGVWEPIETAPINESVLIYIPNAEHYGEGIYRGLQVESDWLPDKPRHWMTNGMSIGRDCGSRQPTHWMPLPSPPEEKQ